MLSIDLDIWTFLVFAVVGVLSGVINTLAGSGSLITLPVFIFLCGLPAPVANGTNRIGVLLQTLVAVYGFKKFGLTDYKGISGLVLAAIAGAVLGSRIAVDLNEQAMNRAIGGLMVFMFFVLLLKPERWIREQVARKEANRHPVTLLVFFLVGIYGGFIQAGVGIFLLAALVLASRYSLKSANGIKTLIVFAFTLPAIIVFLWYGQIHWGYGLLMAIFQAAGAWLGVAFAARVPNANVWIYRLLMVIVLISGLKFFL